MKEVYNIIVTLKDTQTFRKEHLLESPTHTTYKTTVKPVYSGHLGTHAKNCPDYRSVLILQVRLYTFT